MKTNTTNTTTATTKEDIYTTAERAVYIALKARHEKSGLQFLAELQTAQHTDRRARTAPQIAEQLADLESLHKSHRKGYEFFNARANRLTLSDYERALAFTLAQDLKKKAQNESQQIADLYEALNINYTDRADLTQTAIVKILELEKDPAEITDRIYQDYLIKNKLKDIDLTEEHFQELQNIANFRAIINTVGRAVSKLASPEAFNSTVTKSKKATAEEFAQWCNRYGIYKEDFETLKDFHEALKNLKAPKTTKRCRTSECYETMEHRDTKKQQGYYIITHYVTVAPYQYIEDFSTTEDGENDIQYIKTYNPIVEKFQDFEAIENLCNLADLTESERLVISYYCNGLRYYNTKEEIIKYISTATKLSKATVYRRLQSIEKALEPIARKHHLIK